MNGNGSNLPLPADYPDLQTALAEVEEAGNLPLSNGRHERFCHYRASGLSLRESYMQSGFNSKPEHASSSAANLLKRQEVRDRIQYLKKVLNTALHYRRLDVVRELEGIAFAKLTDFLDWNAADNKLSIKDPDKIPPEALPALKSLQITPKGVRIVAHDKLDALRQLANIHGLSQSSQPKAGGVTVVIVSPEKASTATEWQERYSKGREIPQHSDD